MAGCYFGFCLRKIFPDLMNELHSPAAVLDSVLSDCLLLNRRGERREKLSRKLSSEQLKMPPERRSVREEETVPKGNCLIGLTLTFEEERLCSASLAVEVGSSE